MSRLRRFYPKHFARRNLTDILAAVNIVDKETDGDVGGQDLLESQESNFPSRPVQSDPQGADSAETRILRTSEIGQELTQLTTEREQSKTRQKDTQHGLWSDSYSDENSFEDPDLKLGESQNDDTDPLKDPVYPPYTDGIGALNPRYEDADKNQRNIVLHSARSNEEESTEGQDGKSNNKHGLWVCVDLDGTLFSSPEEYQDQNGNHLFGEILQGRGGGPGPREALQELIDGGARVSIYTARQYFDEESEVSRALGLTPTQLLEFQLEEALILEDIPFTDIYIGKKPPADIFVDDRTVPPFDGDWGLVLDVARDRLSKKANDPVKDTVDYHGIKIDIEWPTGSIRSYEGQDTYVTHMKADYGYARGIVGNDGEELDIYLVDRDSDSQSAFIIEQIRDDGSYDEDKIVLGAHSEGEAVDCYLQHMPGYMLGSVREVPVDKLRDALYKGPEDRSGQTDVVPSEEKQAFNLDKAIKNLRDRRTDPYEPDPHAHLSDKEWLYKDQLSGGLADEKSPKDFDQSALNKGIKVELEHTNDESLAVEIAMDHLTEDPQYYDKLEKIEKKRAWIRKIASYSDLAVKAIQDANINEMTKLLSQHVDLNQEYVKLVDSLVREMLTKPELQKQLEEKYGPSEPRRPIEEKIEKDLIDKPSLYWGPAGYGEAPSPTTTQPVSTGLKPGQLGPSGTQPIVRAYLKASKESQGVWPEDDIFDNEYTDGVEDRENREIRRKPQTEPMKYRNV